MKQHLRIIGLSNELPSAGKPLIIPFGCYPHKVGKVMQLINAKTAAMMVAEFDAMAARPGFKGLPIYIGHPDVKSYQDKYQDHRSYGWITGMLVNEDSLELQVQWTAPGSELLANEHFAYFSPNWLAIQGKPGEALPFKILSVGLTQNPMIEYLALACEDGGEDEEITNNQGDSMNLLQRLLALLPEKVQENVKDEDGVVSFFQKMLDGFKALRESQQERWKAEDAAYMALENEDPIQGLADYLGQLAEQAVALANEMPEGVQATLDQVNAELALANEDLDSTRRLYRGVLLDNALADGRITPATRRKWEQKFDAEGADFLGLANELGSIDVAMKTTRSAKDAAPGEGGTATHADVVALANEYQANSKCNFEQAYARAKRQPEFAHLFTSEQAYAQ